MQTAEIFSGLSYAVRLKVGAIVVKEDRIISIGFNGMPSGWDNVCESFVNGELVSKPEVLHAETNALMKLAKCNESGEGASIFITHAPCLHCAKGIHQSGIKEVYFKNTYRSLEGIDFLEKCGVHVEQLK